jgi:IclR helix-turn-helix domain
MTKREPFILLPHAVYDSPAFETLLPIDIAVLLLLIRKHNGYNNGGISLGVREIAARCHCSKATAFRALNRLQEVDLVALVQKGRLVPEIGRPNVASRWRLNFVAAKPEPAETIPESTTKPRADKEAARVAAVSK